RFSRDWSSDVCSSDLGRYSRGRTETGRSNFTPRRTRMNLFGKPTCAGRFGRNCGTTPNPNGGGRGSVSSQKASGFLSPRVRADRSEERRVGQGRRGGR